MAKRAGFEIGGEVIAPGNRKTVDLPVSWLSDHTPVTMSAHVVHGRRSGPTIFVSAGVHGDEVIGIEIIRRLIKSSKIKALRGTLIVVPIVNSFGFINKSRYLPDRRDLNRSFPGSEGGSLAARLANLFLTEIVSRADIGIDLHSAAIYRTNYPQIRVSPDDVESLLRPLNLAIRYFESIASKVGDPLSSLQVGLVFAQVFFGLHPIGDVLYIPF